jgi:uncharacterized protein YbjT (DUF2867 family)
MYLITGATGNTGSVVAKTLLAKGQKVRVMGRSAEKLQSLVSQGAEAFVGDVADAAAVAGALTSVTAAYLMLPPVRNDQDLLAGQERTSDAYRTAAEKTGISHVVCLSSFGADKPDKTGPVTGLHSFEQKMASIKGLNAIFLRAGFFMENHLMQIPAIRKMGTMGGHIKADLQLPQIAAQDIGAHVARLLEDHRFTGITTPELQGQRDVSMAETANILGAAIGKPNLGYTHLPTMLLEMALKQLGFSAGHVKALVEMQEAINSGWMKPLLPRSAETTTPTSIEEFAKDEFELTWKSA